MLELYHGDTAVCAAKARVVLAEKHIDWVGHRVDLQKGEQFDPAYLKLNPNGVVPTLVHDGQVLIESTVICEYLDDAFAEHPLRPANAMGRARVHLWTKREDYIHDTVNTFTNALIFTPDLRAKGRAAQEARIGAIPDPTRRAKWWDMLEHGLDAKPVTDALIRLARHFRDMEAALAQGPWLLGEQFTLADSGLMSFFNRFDLLSLSGLWAEPYPRVAAWYQRAQARPSFGEAITGYIPEAQAQKYRTASSPEWAKVRSKYQEILQII